MINVGINGFGRIGRAIFRKNLKSNIFRVVAINDTNPSVENLIYMLKYDSTYGVLNEDIKNEDGLLKINNNSISMYNNRIISDTPWEKHNVDIIIDASGIHENLNYKSELKQKGIKHQIVTNTPDSKKVDKYVIIGINENSINDESFLISSSICDATAIAPITKLVENIS